MNTLLDNVAASLTFEELRTYLLATVPGLITQGVVNVKITEVDGQSLWVFELLGPSIEEPYVFMNQVQVMSSDGLIENQTALAGNGVNIHL